MEFLLLLLEYESRVEVMKGCFGRMARIRSRRKIIAVESGIYSEWEIR